MYQSNFRAGGAGAHYRTVDLNSNIESASPHRLVSILYDELTVTLARLRAAIGRGDLARQNEAHARALSIVQTLHNGLDFEKGGEIAAALASIYAEAARLIGQGSRARDTKPIEEAQTMLGEIVEAWKAIG